MIVQKASLKDVPQIHQLVNSFAERGEMLARPLSELYETIRDFFVCIEDGKLVGCSALHISWSDLAEVKSVAVAEGSQGKGVGHDLVQACIEEARSLGIPSIFCLTLRPHFFEALEFTRVDRNELPRKVWTECYRCSKFPDCDEIALIKQIS